MVGELKLIKVLSQKILAVDTGEIEVIEGRREIGGGRAHEAFKIFSYTNTKVCTSREITPRIYIYISTKKDLLIVPPYNIIKWIQHKQRKTSAIRNNF